MLRVFGLPQENRAEAARFLVNEGFDSGVVGVDDTPESVLPAREAGLQVWGCRAAFTVRHLPEPEAEPLLARDVDGQPRRWFNSGCPNQRALREAHLSHIRGLAQSGAFAGFMLDGIRFASPNAGEAYFTCFCDTCRDKAHALGADFERMRRHVRDFRERAAVRVEPFDLDQLLEQLPGVEDWLTFRYVCVLEHVQEVRATVDAINRQRRRASPPFLLGAYLFAPVFAPYVGQMYDELAPLLDIVSPMLYRTIDGDACLASEWRALHQLRLARVHPEFTPDDVGGAVMDARNLIGDRPQLVPIVQLNDDLVADCTRAARQAGADGLDYFAFRPGHEAFVREAVAATDD
jgi:hypothetical protein